MVLIPIFIVSAFVPAISANITTFYLSELCPRTPGGEAHLSLGAATESFNSTAIVMAAPLQRLLPYRTLGYDYNTNCKLKVHSSPGHQIVASVRKMQLRDGCTDNLTIYTDDKKHLFCGYRLDTYETSTLTAKEVMIFEFISGPDSQKEFPRSTGFELTVTAYADGPCNTNTLFSCENGRCIAAELNCSKHNHCGDNSNQQCDAVTNTTNTCGGHRFRCANGNCVDNRYICDGFNDCGDSSDESVCGNCSRGEFACQNHKCINSRYVCDKENDCEDWSDEDFNCKYACWNSEFTCTNRRCMPLKKVCNRKNDCGDWSDEKQCECYSHEFKCKSGKCIPFYSWCDGINDCGDNSDEENCRYTCSPYEFTCTNGTCIRSYLRCNGMNDCGDWSDEANCTRSCFSFEETCKNGKCFSSFYRCDGIDHCGDKTDEENCPLSGTWIFTICFSCVGLVILVVSIILFFRKNRN